MRRSILTKPSEASRAKVGLSLLACVVAALAAGQVAATPSGHLVIAFQEITR
jgi:hypothetical protein